MTNWADHFNTYAEACRFFGADTPEDVAREEAFRAEVEAKEALDNLEIRGPVFRVADEFDILEMPF